MYISGFHNEVSSVVDKVCSDLCSNINFAYYLIDIPALIMDLCSVHNNDISIKVLFYTWNPQMYTQPVNHKILTLHLFK